MLPAIIMVAPNSPKVLAKERTKPDISPGQDHGIVTVQNTRHSLEPRVRAASSNVLSILSKAALVLWYMRGKDTTMPARTAAD